MPAAPNPPEPPETCVICLDPIASPCLALPCRHPYDHICLLHWLALRQSCPLCKSPVTHVQVHDAALGHAVQVRRRPSSRAQRPTAV